MANAGLMPDEEGRRTVMGATGQIPHDDDRPSVRVPTERLAEFDRVWRNGKVRALLDKLEEQHWRDGLAGEIK